VLAVEITPLADVVVLTETEQCLEVAAVVLAG
jgi:hypothetical protein